MRLGVMLLLIALQGCAKRTAASADSLLPEQQVEMPDDQRQTALEAYGHDPQGPLTVLLKDDTSCIRCGLCALRCPTEAMTMERLNFVESQA